MFIEINDDLLNLNVFAYIIKTESFNHYKGYWEYGIIFKSCDDKLNERTYYFSKNKRDKIFNEIKQITTKKD